MNDCRITFRLPADLWEEVARYAVGQGLTLSQVIRVLLQGEHLREHQQRALPNG